MSLSLLNLNKKSPFAAKPNPVSGERPAGEATKDIAPSENLFQKWLIGGALFALPLLLFVLYYKTTFQGLVNNSAMDYAQIGRNLSEGRGFTTYFLRPLALTHGSNPFRQPDVNHVPLFPVLLALLFGARGATDANAAYVSGVFYLLTTPVLFWLGSRLFSRTVGLLAALIFTANPLMLEYATSGLPITLYTFLMTCLLAAVYQIAVFARNQEDGGEPVAATSPLPKAAFVFAGLLSGGLYLTDQIFLWTLPVIFTAVVVLSRRQKAKALAYYAAPLCLLILPWMVRTALLTGNPFFGLRGMEVWMGTKDFYPGATAYRYAPADLLPGVGLFNAVVKKILLGAGEVVQAFPQVSASWMLAFLLPSLLFRFKDAATNHVRRVMMYCFAGILVGLLPFGVEMPVFVCLIPTMLIFAIAYLIHLVEQSQLPRSSVVLLVCLLSGAVLLPVLRDLVLTEKAAPLLARAPAHALKAAAAPDDVVLTDQPWLVAWQSDRPAIWLPVVDINVKNYRTRFPHLRWLFLTDQARGFSPEWQTIYNGFARWNQVYVEAKTANKPAPGTISVSGSGYPLLEGLRGFTVVEPAADNSPFIVIAGLPQTEASAK